MNKLFFISFILLFGFRCANAKDLNHNDSIELGNYLDNHCIIVDTSDANAFTNLLLSKNKNFIIYGQGGKHSLLINNKIFCLLTTAINKPNKLKKVLFEVPRSLTYLIAQLANDNYTLDTPITNLNFLNDLIERWKRIPNIAYVNLRGIDFERSDWFYLSINNLLYKYKSLNNNLLNEMTSGIYNPIKNPNESFTESCKRFVNYYKQLKNRFDEDSVAIRRALNNDSVYDELYYLISNPNNTNPSVNRNPALANNIITEIEPFDTNQYYLLSIGAAHVKIQNDMLTQKAPNLKGRILTMTLYCHECENVSKEVEESENKGMFDDKKFGYFLSSIAQPKGDLVLFDLSELPSKYERFRLYGDLILVGIHQK